MPMISPDRARRSMLSGRHRRPSKQPAAAAISEPVFSHHHLQVVVDQVDVAGRADLSPASGR